MTKRSRRTHPRLFNPERKDITMKSIQYPVKIHPKSLARLTQANTNVAFAQQQAREAQTRLQIAQTHLEELLNAAKDLQVELGQIGEDAVLENFNVGWTLPDLKAALQDAPEPAAMEPEVIGEGPEAA
jgi:hypothetical protein